MTQDRIPVENLVAYLRRTRAVSESAPARAARGGLGELYAVAFALMLVAGDRADRRRRCGFLRSTRLLWISARLLGARRSCWRSLSVVVPRRGVTATPPPARGASSSPSGLSRRPPAPRSTPPTSPDRGRAGTGLAARSPRRSPSGAGSSAEADGGGSAGRPKPKPDADADVPAEGPTPGGHRAGERQVADVRGLRLHASGRWSKPGRTTRRWTASSSKALRHRRTRRGSTRGGASRGDTIGVIPPGARASATRASASTGQVDRLLRPGTGELVTSAAAICSAASPSACILAHELTHAIDDQHFELERLDRRSAPSARTRRSQAALAPSRATRTYFMFAVRRSVPPAADQAAGGARRRDTDRRPAVRLAAPGLAVHGRAMRSSARSMRRGGSGGGRTRRSSTFPRSTEQVIHPERYPNDAPHAGRRRRICRRSWDRVGATST